MEFVKVLRSFSANQRSACNVTSYGPDVQLTDSPWSGLFDSGFGRLSLLNRRIYFVDAAANLDDWRIAYGNATGDAKVISGARSTIAHSLIGRTAANFILVGTGGGEPSKRRSDKRSGKRI